jgi:hypothetical protein
MIFPAVFRTTLPSVGIRKRIPPNPPPKDGTMVEMVFVAVSLTISDFGEILVVEAIISSDSLVVVPGIIPHLLLIPELVT